MKVSVCLIQPENYPHWRAFLEVAQLLCVSFESLGHRCPLRMNWVEPGALNIVIGYHFLGPGHIGSFSRAPCIFYQLEQLSVHGGWLTADREQVLRTASEIWDYSEENVAFLRAKGFRNVSHLPLGYHPALQRIHHRPEEEKDVDVLFYGARNERRGVILNQLRERFRLRTLFGDYGEARDRWIARSRVVLNIHFYDRKVAEQVRLSYLLNNECFVLSEEFESEESESDIFARGMVSGAHDALTGLCERYLGDPQARRIVAARGLELFRQRPMVRFLEPLIETPPPRPVRGETQEEIRA